MDNGAAGRPAVGLRSIRYLTYLMFFMFAMTTDSVGLIIPRVIAEFGLSLTVAGALHYGSMAGIAGAGLLLGSLADRLGRKRAILLGLALFAGTSFIVPLTHSFGQVLGLIILAGMAIGIFKTAAVALVADMSRSATELTSTMNMAEGFFGVGAIIGNLIVSQLFLHEVSWRWLYSIAGALCLVLIAISSLSTYPAIPRGRVADSSGARATLRLLGNRYALGFSLAAFAYVAVECAIYVWMPTLLEGIHGPASAYVAYALPAFFLMRALGRFIGAWLLRRFDWSQAIAISAGVIFVCFLCSAIGGVGVALYLLPLSGLFMSIIYPTINSKGVGCFPPAEQGAAAGVILFFTCAGALLGPLSMGWIGDLYGGARSGFLLATGVAALLAAGLAVNAFLKPARAQLARFATQPSMSS
jgi:fucose permease